MASVDDLPADQRAVLQLVLQRGRSYDDIAALLSIDRAAVRQRALAAMDAIGPRTGVAPERRALITDYLLGQLPARVAADTREHLARTPAERAWARVIVSELAQMNVSNLPEIPLEAAPATPEPAVGAVAREDPARAPRAERTRRPERPAGAVAAASAERPTPGAEAGSLLSAPRGRRSSRLGGAILLAVAAIVVIVVVVVLATSGGSNKHSQTTAASTPTSTSSTGSTGASTTSPQPIAQVNLTSPQSGSKAAGIAQVIKQGNVTGIEIVAAHVPPNTKHDAYAVWLYNSPSDSYRLGFVNPGVSSNGRLSTIGPLPANASHFKQLIITLETQGRPKQPGKIILQGQLGLS
jgi:hypothetical protein